MMLTMLIANEIIDEAHFNTEDAGVTEQEVYATFPQGKRLRLQRSWRN